MLPHRRSVHLAEGFEQPLDPVGGNAHTGVADVELQPPSSPRLSLPGHFDAHLARTGELECIADQVVQNLAQA